MTPAVGETVAGITTGAGTTTVVGTTTGTGTVSEPVLEDGSEPGALRLELLLVGAGAR